MRTLRIWSRATLLALVSAALSLLCASLRPAMAYIATGAGYMVIDGEEPGGPLYTWDDIGTTGTLVSFDDTGDDQVVVPFTTLLNPFVFMGGSYTSVSICTNGFLQFLGTDTTPANAPIPNAAAPNRIIAAFWDDLIYSSGQSQVRYQTLTAPNRFVVQWTNWLVQVGSENMPVTFQVALYLGPYSWAVTNKPIRIQYQVAANSGCTVGIENSTGTLGLQYVSGGLPAGNSLYGGLAVGFLPTPWLGGAIPWPTTPTPLAPTSLVQSDDPGGPAEPGGFVDADGSVSFRGWVAHTVTTTQVALQVEVKPITSAFDGTGLLLGNLVPGSGGTSQATPTGLADDIYKWRARTVAGDQASGWVNFGYPGGLDIDFAIGPETGTPQAPTALVQSAESDGPAEPAGFVDTDGTVWLSATVSHSVDTTPVQLQVEVKPEASAFDGTDLLLGNLVPGSGGTSEVGVQLADADGDYKWRARTAAGDQTTAWVNFGPEPGTDFVIMVNGYGPQIPEDLAQSDNPGGSSEAAGFIDTDGSVSVRAWVSHSDPDISVQLQVEVKPTTSVFDGTGLLPGSSVPGDGGTSEATATGLTNGSYKWRVRTVAGGETTGWVNFGLEPGVDFTISAGAPQEPTALVQSDDPGGPAEPAGYIDTDGDVSVRATVSHSDPDASVQLQVEVKPTTSAFDGTGLLLGNTVPGSGGTSGATVTGLAGGDYKWRARTVAGDQATAWVNAGTESGTDFSVDLSPPPPSGDGGGGGGGGGSGGKKNGVFCGGGVEGSGPALWLVCALVAALACARRRTF